MTTRQKWLPEVGDVVGSRWELTGVLGEGGMGLVMRARCNQTGLSAAVKLVRPELVEREIAVRRFERELDAMKQLKHPNLARLVDYGVHQSCPYTVLEYAQGTNLAELTANSGPMSPWLALKIAEQLAAAAGAVHASGLIHRDIKPANVLVDLTPNAVRATLVDFGITKSFEVAQTPLTKSGHIVGTVGYVAPEAIMGTDDVGVQADVYAIGVLLLELLLGRRLYDDANPLLGMMRQVKQGVAVPRRLAAHPIGKLVEDCTAKFRKDRIADCAVLAKRVAEALESAAGIEPLSEDEVAAFFREFYPRDEDLLTFLGGEDSDAMVPSEHSTSPPQVESVPPGSVDVTMVRGTLDLDRHETIRISGPHDTDEDVTIPQLRADRSALVDGPTARSAAPDSTVSQPNPRGIAPILVVLIGIACVLAGALGAILLGVGEAPDPELVPGHVTVDSTPTEKAAAAEPEQAMGEQPPPTELMAEAKAIVRGEDRGDEVLRTARVWLSASLTKHQPTAQQRPAKRRREPVRAGAKRSGRSSANKVPLPPKLELAR